MLVSDDSNRSTFKRLVTCPLTNDLCDRACALLMSSEDGYHVCALALIPISDTFGPVPMVDVPNTYVEVMDGNITNTDGKGSA